LERTERERVQAMLVYPALQYVQDYMADRPNFGLQLPPRLKRQMLEELMQVLLAEFQLRRL
jgi:hypothetical protein